MTAPLFVHSTYSFLYGTIPPAALAREAKRMGYEALALTDRNGVYGIPSFAEACEKEGIRPIFGTELTWDTGRCVLLARNRSGFSAICRMLTRRAKGNFDARAALSACLDPEQGQEGLAILTDDPALLAAGAKSGGAGAKSGGAGAKSGGAGAKSGGAGAKSGARAAGLYALLTRENRSRWRSLAGGGSMPVAAPEVAFLAPGERRIQRLLVAIGAGKTVNEVGDTELSGPESILPAPRDLEKLYACCPEALGGTEMLVGGMEAGTLFGGWVFPRYGPENGLDAAKILRDRVLRGARARYGRLAPRVMKRIDYELSIIDDKGFSDYFLVVKDIVAGSGRTCGRGSAAASIVSYSLGITDVDPLRHGLYFERFLNPGRKDPPDIDVDFAWDERDALLEKSAGRFRGRARRAGRQPHLLPAPLRAQGDGQGPGYARGGDLRLRAQARRGRRSNHGRIGSDLERDSDPLGSHRRLPAPSRSPFGRAHRGSGRTGRSRPPGTDGNGHQGHGMGQGGRRGGGDSSRSTFSEIAPSPSCGTPSPTARATEMLQTRLCGNP